VVAAERHVYTILVAAFTSADRARRLVEELVSAGYAADAAEVDGGPTRGRFVQVKIGGYTSEPEVQRALQQIRELPGGYTDARIIESY
jgi:cell division septation protein DedD